MGIKEVMLDTKSDQGAKFYTTMLRWLDNPGRLKYDNPETLVNASGIRPGDTVLEIGCGSGFFTEAISKQIGKSGKLYATDIHDIAIEETGKKVAALGLDNVTVQIDNALASAFPDATFDAVLLYGVVPAPVIPTKDITAEICRLLKPGGMYAIWTKTPFWTPFKSAKGLPFKKKKKSQGVFLLRKDGALS